MKPNKGVGMALIHEIINQTSSSEVSFPQSSLVGFKPEDGGA